MVTHVKTTTFNHVQLSLHKLLLSFTFNLSISKDLLSFEGALFACLHLEIRKGTLP